MDLGLPQKILIVRADCIGDMFSITPSIRAIHNKYPNAQIDALCTARQAVALENSPYISNIHSFNKKKYLSTFQTILTVRKELYDIVINFHGGSRTACFLASVCKYKRAIAVGTPPKALARFFEAPLGHSDETHVIHIYLDAMKQLGLDIDSPKMDYFIPEVTLAKSQFPKKNNVLRFAIFIGNMKRPHICWPIEEFVKLTQYLLVKNIEIYIVGGPAEEASAHAFDHPSLYLFFNKPFVELATLLTTCDALISCSSGPAHLASALGTPVLSMLNPFNVRHWRTLGEKDCYVQPVPPKKEVRDISFEQVIQMVDTFMEREGMTRQSDNA